MKKSTNGFTLIEILSVVVILGITFMLIVPSITSLIKMGNKTETDLINTSSNEYTNEELYLMLQNIFKNMNDNYQNLFKEVENLKNNIVSSSNPEELENKN